MASSEARLEAALRQAATGAGGVFAIERLQLAGEPPAWEEWIRFERGREQCYGRVRSAADEGGAPIGTWRTGAEDWRVQPIAQALCDARIWARTSDVEIEPGASLVSWSCATPAGIHGVVVKSGSPQLTELAALDLELRRIANTVEEAGHGASLVCRLDLDGSVAGRRARVTLINSGDRLGVIGNPLASQVSGRDYFRLEAAVAPLEEEGVTGYGADFKPIAVAAPTGDEPAPWRDPWLLLEPDRPLEFPLRLPVDLAGNTSYLLRAVYSHYALIEEIAGLPVIRGRAFSNELELSA